jgi:hypothetical protein
MPLMVQEGSVDGTIMMWPGSRLHFFEAIANPRWEVSRCPNTL